VKDQWQIPLLYPRDLFHHTRTMNWAKLRQMPWLDTRAHFVSRIPRSGTLLDIGSSDGETLRHFAELRPDLKFFSTDLEGAPQNYPPGCEFFRGDIQSQPLPWADGSMSGITCMHLVEHLTDLSLLIREAKRLLRPGGMIYFETPHTKTVSLPSLVGKYTFDFTMNFFDDKTHTKPVVIEDLAAKLTGAGLEVIGSGTSRNLVFAASHLVYQFLPASRKKFTARAHWIGWSAYVMARKVGSV
jgi:SAM-dependent methyltransferase